MKIESTMTEKSLGTHIDLPIYLIAVTPLHVDATRKCVYALTLPPFKSLFCVAGAHAFLRHTGHCCAKVLWTKPRNWFLEHTGWHRGKETNKRRGFERRDNIQTRSVVSRLLRG